MAVSMSEKFVSNFFTIAIARVAMIVTPILLAIFGWAGAQIWQAVEGRLSAIEASDARQATEIQDHESRLKFSAEKADQYSIQIERRFNDLTDSLKDLNTQIGGINGSIIRLQTTIENRLPPRQTGALDPVPQQ